MSFPLGALVLGSVMLCLAAAPTAEATFAFSGDLSVGDPTFNAPLAPSGLTCTPGTVPVAYDSYSVTHATGPLRVQITLGTLPAVRLLLYRGTFDPGSPCLNVVGSAFTNFASVPAVLTAAAIPPDTYTVVVRGGSVSDIGTYSGRVDTDVAPIVTAPGAAGGPNVRGFGPSGGPVGVSFFAYPAMFTGGASVAIFYTGLGGDLQRKIVTGAGAGGAAQVRLFERDGSEFVSFTAYPGFNGAVRVAACDASNSRWIVTAPGPGGGPHVKVWQVDPVTKVVSVVTQFFAYAPSFTGGVWVACGPVALPSLSSKIVTGADAGGGPHVRVWDIGSGPGFAVTDLGGFFAFAPTFTGGVRVATGALDNDMFHQIIVAAGPGGGPHVRVFKTALCTPTPCSVNAPKEIGSFFAFDPGFGGGVFVSAGDLEGLTSAQIITGAGAGGPPRVRAFDLGSGTPVVVADFLAYDASFTGGVHVAGRR